MRNNARHLGTIQEIMNSLLLISVIIASAVTLTSGSGSCQGSMPCTLDNDGVIKTLSQKECKKKTGCCWNSKKSMCFYQGSKSLERSLNFGPPPDDSKNAFGDLNNLNKKINNAKSKSESEERSLAFPGICPVKHEFPLTCKLHPNLPYVFDPPTNIPYCYRIPCSLNKREQAIYDKDLSSCGRQPGCYFDKALYEYRKYNIPVMPGVPVCHFAIRNEEFHKYAKKVIAFNGEWNPYFTHCIIEILKKMEDTRCGCDLLKVLEVFNIPPKMAGWGSINRFHCYLIGGCWVPGRGCFYPASFSNVLVKSGQRFKIDPREITYGRPKCQHFATSPPIKVLESYHKCLIAGCSIDTNVLAGYYSNLYEIGSELSPAIHWKYWESVTKGEIGSYNLEKISLLYPSGKNRKPTPPPPTTKNPFLNPGLFAGFNPKPALSNCGPAYKLFGGRPCPPPKFPNPFTQLYCPYKTVNFPKFPKLEGSIEGCCDINPCYISRKDIRSMHSGATHYYSEWSYYTPCSSSCGWGTQTRTRRCVSVNNHKCGQSLKEQRRCKAEDCGKWAAWGPWSICWGCGGVKTRKRVCLPAGSYCKGDNEEVNQCPPCFGK